MTLFERLAKHFRNRVSQLMNRRVRAEMRKRKPAADITLFCNNCVAGMVYHDFGLPFMSPTINCWMTCGDFIYFQRRP